jgi:hypothetical protein
MNRVLTFVLGFAVAFWMTVATASAQGHGGHGKPAQTGLTHAAATANSHGVEHGISNAEAKQTEHDITKAEKKVKSKGKKTRTRKNKKS